MATHTSPDIAQLVFSDLARKAPALPEKVVLAGWLHRATIFSARQILRGERRRCAREQQAVTMNAISSETDTYWEQIRPLLDEALQRLDPTDRDALLLRFFEQQSLAQVGARLGSSEDAVRKRIQRALEKLRAILARRGVTTTAAVLTTAISANAMQNVPAGLAVTLTHTAFAGAGTGSTLTLWKIMTAIKLKLAVSALVITGAATIIVAQHQAQARLRAENESLRRKNTQLAGDLASASNQTTTADVATRLTDEQFNELLKLRGEVGVLRRQTNDLATLADENRKLHKEVDAMNSISTKQLFFNTQRMLVTDAAKQLNHAMLAYADQNNGVYPSNFNTFMNLITNSMDATPGSVGFKVFELMPGVFTENDVSPTRILFRETTPRQMSDGRWSRLYGMSDKALSE